MPLVGALLGALFGAGSIQIDRNIDTSAYWQYSPSTASTVLSAIVGSTAALVGFVVTVTVLVVQMATGTFSARYMRLWYRDRMLKATLAVLMGTLTFAFSLLRRVESNFVPNLGVTVAGFLVAASLLLFMFFFDRFIHRLRPVAVAALVARAGQRTFDESVRAAASPDAPDFAFEPYDAGEEPRLVVHSSAAGAIQAIDGAGLVRWARERECLVVIPHLAGDFVSVGVPLMRVYGHVPNPGRAEHRLRGMVALGEERTIQQDTAFAVRIMVDIALMALSPAVNAPTTAVQVIDHLGETLRQIGTTDLSPTERPGAGRRWVVMRARRWEDFLALGVTEIRQYGAASIQVLRRLRAMLEELEQTVRPEHRAAVEHELARLDAVVEERWSRSVDLDRASAADGQGIGGPSLGEGAAL